MAAEVDAPRNQLVLRSREGTFLRMGPKEGRTKADDLGVEQEPVAARPEAGVAEYSPDGVYLALATKDTVEIVQSQSGDTVLELSRHRVVAVAWSPCSRFFVTWERPSETENLNVWSVATGDKVAGFFQRAFQREDWPSVKFTEDGSVFGHAVKNEVQFFSTDDPSAGVVARLRLPGVDKFSVSPGPSPHVAAFVPEVKGGPGRVAVYRYPSLEGTPVASKTFFNAQTATLKWSSTGHALLVQTSTDVDSTGTSYYGSTALYLIHADGRGASQVQLGKDGPVHDFAWSPGGKEFVVVAGRMPPRAAMFDDKGEPRFEIGQVSRNCVSWNTHGRFFALAGFGNLAGELDFWDKNKMKKIGATESRCAIQWSWSPCGRFFLTATVAPRMNIDNGFKIFAYNGALLHEESIEKLYQVSWRPAPVHLFADRPSIKRRELLADEQGITPEKADAKKASSAAKYRPPGSSGEFAAKLRAERSGLNASRATKVASKPSQDRTVGLPPGAAPPADPSASKKKKKNKNKKKGGDAAGAASGSAAPAPAPAPVSAGGDKDAIAKRVRAINKKLRQIDSLKAQRDGGKELDAEQEDKLSKEDGFRQEVAQLEAELARME